MAQDRKWEKEPAEWAEATFKVAAEERGEVRWVNIDPSIGGEIKIKHPVSEVGKEVTTRIEFLLLTHACA
jgi:hypothetical protein